MNRLKSIKFFAVFLSSIIFFFATKVFADVQVQLQIPIDVPGAQKGLMTVCSTNADSSIICNGIANYISNIYTWLLGVVGIMAVASLMYAGFLWLTASGNSGQVKKAQEVIQNAIIGLALLLGSYLILYTINPELTKLPSLTLRPVKNLNLSENFANLNEGSGGTPGGTGGSAVSANGSYGYSNNYHVQLDTSVVSSFDTAMDEIKKTQPNFQVAEIGGARPGEKFDSGRLTCHGSGLAFDINATDNFCTKNPTNPASVGCEKTPGRQVGQQFSPYKDPKSVTKEVVAILAKNGWCWGGNWSSFKDYMHFSRCSNECPGFDFYKW